MYTNLSSISDVLSLKIPGFMALKYTIPYSYDKPMNLTNGPRTLKTKYFEYPYLIFSQKLPYFGHTKLSKLETQNKVDNLHIFTQDY